MRRRRLTPWDVEELKRGKELRAAHFENLLFAPELQSGEGLRLLEELEPDGNQRPGGPACGERAALDGQLADHVTKPPVSITGDKTQKVGIGNLAFSMPISHFSTVEGQICRWLGKGEQWDHGANGYTRTRSWDLGCRLYWKPAEDGGGLSHFRVVIDQGLLERCRFDQLKEICLFFNRLDAIRCTRIDLNVDVSRDVLNVDQVVEAVKLDDYMGYKQSNEFIGRSRGRGVNNHGVTFGLRGKNGSGRYGRIYDKFFESGGLIDCTRIEWEFTKTNGVSNAIFKHLCEEFQKSQVEVERFIAVNVTQAIDFRRFTGQHRSIERSERYSWWESVMVVGKKCLLKASYVKKKFVDQIAKRVKTAGAAVAVLREVVVRSGYDADAMIASVVASIVQAADGCKPRAEAERFMRLGGNLGVLVPDYLPDDIPF